MNLEANKSYGIVPSSSFGCDMSIPSSRFWSYDANVNTFVDLIGWSFQHSSGRRNYDGEVSQRRERISRFLRTLANTKCPLSNFLSKKTQRQLKITWVLYLRRYIGLLFVERNDGSCRPVWRLYSFFAKAAQLILHNTLHSANYIV